MEEVGKYNLKMMGTGGFIKKGDFIKKGLESFCQLCKLFRISIKKAQIIGLGTSQNVEQQKQDKMT